MADNKSTDLPLYVHDSVSTPPTKPSGYRRVIDLDQTATAADTDEVVIQRGTQSFRMARSTLLGASASAYASMYTDDGNLASPAITQTPGSTPVLYTGFVTNGQANDASADAANDKIVIGTTGIYLAVAQFSFSGTNSATFNFEVTVISDSPVTPTGQRCTRKLGTGGDVGSCSLTGLVSLSANDEVGIYVDGGATDDINTHQAQFTLHRVG